MLERETLGPPTGAPRLSLRPDTDFPRACKCLSNSACLDSIILVAFARSDSSRLKCMYAQLLKPKGAWGSSLSISATAWAATQGADRQRDSSEHAETKNVAPSWQKGILSHPAPVRILRKEIEKHCQFP